MSELSKQDIIQEAASDIREYLEQYTAYDFVDDIECRMEHTCLSSTSLAARCGISRPAVDKWRHGTARPNSKEQMKRLGMALEMNENELNSFLFVNGYPKLYIRNPFDCVTKLLLYKNGGKANNVSLYDEILRRIRPEDFCIPAKYMDGISGDMSRDFRCAADEGRTSEWFAENNARFCADRTSVRISSVLSDFIRAFMDTDNVSEFADAKGMPATVRKALYEILSGKAVKVRSLREKLVAIAFFFNFTEDEIDMLLSFAKLRSFTDVRTRAELSQLVTLRQAHERYPLYELKNLEHISSALDTMENGELKAVYRERCETRIPFLTGLAEYYEKHKTDEDILFEEEYTSYSAKNISDYIFDVLTSLQQSGDLTEAETESTLINWKPADDFE